LSIETTFNFCTIVYRKKARLSGQTATEAKENAATMPVCLRCWRNRASAKLFRPQETESTIFLISIAVAQWQWGLTSDMLDDLHQPGQR
jgi:hypothetical protein